MSEALIFASTNPQYDDRLFIELHENTKLKPGENMLCTEIVSDIQNTVLQNRRAFDKDLPVLSVNNFDQFLTPPNCRRRLWTTSML